MIKFHLKNIISKDATEFFVKENKKLEKRVEQLAKGTEQKMKDIIKVSKQRSQAGQIPKLENSIKAEKIGGLKVFGWGIGNIKFLNKFAPYWKFVNSGVSLKGMRIPGRGKRVPPGAFAPGEQEPKQGTAQQGRWQSLGFGWSFKAKQGIRNPLHYIEKTKFWIQGQLVKFKSRMK